MTSSSPRPPPDASLGAMLDAAGRPLEPGDAGDAWHRTGDLGRLDANGWLWSTGRAPRKRLVETGGENVNPAEVEPALLDHPSVAEAFVFGRADPPWGEAVRAACVLRPGAEADEAELIAFVGGRLARYERPGSVVFAASPIDRSLASAR